jgi:fatty acid desaturase
MSSIPGKSPAIAWYRTHIPSAELKRLHERSDVRGFAQTLGYLGLLVLTGGAVLSAAGKVPVGVLLALIFLHGTCFAFQINAVHELGHGTVFKTKALNAFFVRIFAFLGWINFEMFGRSHIQHHRYTLHAPDDLEVVLPLKVMVRDFFRQGFVNPRGFWDALRGNARAASGRLSNAWEESLFPATDPARRLPVQWARLVLGGHMAIILVSAIFHWWLLPVVTTFAPFYGGWLFFLCNNTQHIGLQDDVPDFRLCSRTFTLNPVAQFLYWHMNFHIEHHMYAAVPCYHLGRLHRAIRHDLPPITHGLAATWREIARIQKMQNADPDYQYVPPLPGPSLPAKAIAA